MVKGETDVEWARARMGILTALHLVRVERALGYDVVAGYYSIVGADGRWEGKVCVVCYPCENGG